MTRRDDRPTSRAKALELLIATCEAHARPGEPVVEAFDRLLFNNGAGIPAWTHIMRVLDRTFAEVRMMVETNADVPQIKLDHGRSRHFPRARYEVAREGNRHQEMQTLCSQEAATYAPRAHRADGSEPSVTTGWDGG